jgi:hypothetical protein
MTENNLEPFWLQGSLNTISRIDPTVASACRDLVEDLFPIKKPTRKSRDTQSLLSHAIGKHLDALFPIQEAIKSWLALYDLQKPDYLLSRELSDYGGSPRLMSKWIDHSDSRLLYELIDFLVYVEDDLNMALNEKKTKKALKQIAPPVSCYFCWRGVDPPRQYCSHHTQVKHPAVYMRFQSHLKRMGIWKKMSDRTSVDHNVPYYCRSGPGLSGNVIKIRRPNYFHWSDSEAPSVIREMMPKAAIRLDEIHCWEALREGWANFVEKTLAAFESESFEERDLLLDHPEIHEGVLWVILERYELWSRWWEEHQFPGRGASRPRHAKVHESLVQKYLNEGLSKTEIARRSGLSRQAVYKIIDRIEEKTKIPKHDGS